MSSKYYILLCIAIYASNALSNGPSPGEIVCEMGRTDGCQLVWDIKEHQKSGYQVERFDARLNAWTIEQNDVSASGMLDYPVVPGYLYRVLGCDLDKRGGAQEDCVSSTVFWAPVIPESADQIPEFVYDASGESYLVFKDARLSTQILQYNIYLLFREIKHLDISAFPKMTEPPGRPETIAEKVHDNVFIHYDDQQRGQLGLPIFERSPANPNVGSPHPDGHEFH